MLEMYTTSIWLKNYMLAKQGNQKLMNPQMLCSVVQYCFLREYGIQSMYVDVDYRELITRRVHHQTQFGMQSEGR